VRLLLDTCAFLWLSGQPDRLSPSAALAINDESNELLLSDVTVWEIVLKHRVGKLPLPADPREWIPEQIAFFNLPTLPIDRAAIFRAGELAVPHRDPFDRQPAAQALVGALHFVTSDRVFDDLGVSRCW
jgi:PIN domain nuclease of toxin-antitoxin system